MQEIVRTENRHSRRARGPRIEEREARTSPSTRRNLTDRNARQPHDRTLTTLLPSKMAKSCQMYTKIAVCVSLAALLVFSGVVAKSQAKITNKVR